ncbi:MAG: response regulator [Gammaproteobacteria bacterium]|nr:response regulator [Gammaproteobacteria bacterium]MDX2460934.1 response regulator [Gammaproteobacteria bacterium]
MKSDNSYTVAVFGIPEFERELVERIFSLSESRENIYQIADESQHHAADIALVDQGDATAASEFKRFQSNGHALPAVIIPNGKDPETDFWVKRPVTAMRMLGALDKLVENQVSGVNRLRPKAQSPAPVPAPPEAAAPKTDDTITMPAVAAAIYKALVVDDSLPVRKQVNIALRRAGITAEFAEDAESALKLIESRSYDILFLDVVLPGKDGYEICKAVKRDKNKKHIPVVMLTGKSSPFNKVKGKLSGCDAYLTKPVSLKEFNKTLSKWLTPPLSFEAMGDPT